MQKPPLLVALIAVLVVVLCAVSLRYTPLGRAALAAVGDAPTAESTGTTTPSLIDVLERLQDQNRFLTDEVAGLHAKAEEANLKAIFTRTLRRGDSGDDVKLLQTLLADVSGTVATSTTGFYGGLTEQAVRDFQTLTGLPETGVFDVLTRDKIAASMQQSQIASDVASADVPIDLSSIPDPEQNMQNLQNQVAQLTLKVANTQTIVDELQSHISNLETEVSGLQGSVAAQPTPAPVAPTVQPLALSSIQVGSLTKTSATVTWTTNNPATSEVDYSVNSSMPVSQTLVVKSPNMVTSHSAVLSPLAAGVVYYYRVISADTTNTIANSSNLTFTTPSH